MKLSCLFVLTLTASGIAYALPAAETVDSTAGSGCFPAVGYKMPASVPASLNGWWCPHNQEYGFVGFSYAIDACGIALPGQIVRLDLNEVQVRIPRPCSAISKTFGTPSTADTFDFTVPAIVQTSSEWIMNRRNPVQILTMPCYGSDDIVNAAWQAGLGVHALIWVCFDGSATSLH